MVTQRTLLLFLNCIVISKIRFMLCKYFIGGILYTRKSEKYSVSLAKKLLTKKDQKSCFNDL